MMSMSEFCRLYSQYIVENKDYIKTLFDNGISYLLYDSIYTAFNESCCDPSCTAAKKQYLAHFLAGGISGVVNGYVSTGCMTPKDELENILIESFSGNMFR